MFCGCKPPERVGDEECAVSSLALRTTSASGYPPEKSVGAPTGSGYVETARIGDIFMGGKQREVETRITEICASFATPPWPFSTSALLHGDLRALKNLLKPGAKSKSECRVMRAIRGVEEKTGALTRARRRVEWPRRPGRAATVRAPRRTTMKLQPRSFIPYVILIALVVSTSLLQPNILSLDWLGIKTNTILPLALATAGQTLVLFTGGIDLSIGGVISLTNSLEATRMSNSVESMVLFTLGMLVLGLLLGAVNGIIIVRVGLQPFIATLITWSIYGGLALWILPTDRGNVPQGFIDTLLAHPGGIPVSLLLLVVWVCPGCI